MYCGFPFVVLLGISISHLPPEPEAGYKRRSSMGDALPRNRSGVSRKKATTLPMCCQEATVEAEDRLARPGVSLDCDSKGSSLA